MPLGESQARSPVVGFWTWDIKHDWVFGDASLAHYFGLAPEQVAGGAPLSRFLDAVHRDDRASVRSAIEQSVRSGTHFRAQYRVHNRDREIRTISALGNCHFDERGAPSSFPGWFMDVSASRISPDPALETCALHLEKASDALAGAGESALERRVRDLLDEINRRGLAPRPPDGA